jgi:predicted DNA-binding transcriptional regulator AlpA
MPTWKEEFERELPPDVDFENDPDYLSTAEAARLSGLDPKALWRLVEKGRLSKPVCLSPRRCYWPRKDIEALPGKTVPPEDDFVRSRAQVAAKLGVCPETVSRMTADGRLAKPAVKNGRLYFREKDIELAIEKRLNDSRMSLSEATELTGIKWSDILWLKRLRRFPRFHYPKQKFRRGDVLAWWEKYQVEGCPSGNPEWDAAMGDLILPPHKKTQAKSK